MSALIHCSLLLTVAWLLPVPVTDSTTPAMLDLTSSSQDLRKLRFYQFLHLADHINWCLSWNRKKQRGRLEDMAQVYRRRDWVSQSMIQEKEVWPTSVSTNMKVLVACILLLFWGWGRGVSTTQKDPHCSIMVWIAWTLRVAVSPQDVGSSVTRKKCQK